MSAARAQAATSIDGTDRQTDGQTLLLATMPNIHRFKKRFSLADSAINLA